MKASLDLMEKILAEVRRRDQFTCQQCGKSMEHVERYLVLHLVPRTREARWPAEYELNARAASPAASTHSARLS
jgi:5-methylcytosine-specific restriction endonuclease McrA